MEQDRSIKPPAGEDGMVEPSSPVCYLGEVDPAWSGYAGAQEILPCLLALAAAPDLPRLPGLGPMRPRITEHADMLRRAVDGLPEPAEIDSLVALIEALLPRLADPVLAADLRRVLGRPAD